MGEHLLQPNYIKDPLDIFSSKKIDSEEREPGNILQNKLNGKGEGEALSDENHPIDSDNKHPNGIDGRAQEDNQGRTQPY